MTRCLVALGACVISLAVRPAGADAVAREPQPGLLSTFAPAPAQCSAFRIGLTPEAAERERREEAREAIAAREAQKTARELRAYVLSTSARPHTGIGTAAQRRSVSAAELVQASARLGRNATATVVAANEELNATSERRYYLYDPEGRLIAETEATTASRPRIQYEYIWFAGEPLVQIEHTESDSPIISYYFTDHLGTPILQTNESAEIVWQAEYDPYGGIHALRRGESKHQPLRFPGQEAEPAVETIYNVFRWYRSDWGRYTQPDPIGMQGGFNLFAYALDNPINYDDPLGLRVRMCCRIIPFTVHLGNALRMVPPGASFPPQRHCFFQFESSPNNQPLGLHGTQSPAGYINAIRGRDTGRVMPNAPFDRGNEPSDVCGPWAQDPCNDVDQCVRNAGSNYPSPSQYSFLGPNSNTFAFTVARQCYVRPPHPVDAPGWNAAPPQP